MKTLKLESRLLGANLQQLRAAAGGAKLIGDLSCDADGLGLVQTAKLLWESGVRFFAVDAARDALTLRREGLGEAEILLLHSTTSQSELETLLDAGGIATVASTEAAMTLNGVAERRATVAEAHLRLDAGGGAFGFLPGEAQKVESVYRDLQSVAISGVCAGLSAQGSLRRMEQQLQVFRDALAELRRRGLETGLVHALDAAPLLRHKELDRFDAVRADGGALAGRYPANCGLHPVGVIETTVTESVWLPTGASVGAHGKLRRPARVGLIPVGYGDGFGVRRPTARLPSLLRNRVPAITVDGKRVRVLGKLTPDHVLVDLTKLNCSAGASARLDANPLFCKGLPRVYG